MQFLRWILFPFSILYGIITEIRNLLYSVGVFSSYGIPVKSIVIGNLSAGGTGKTPHTAYIATYLKDKRKIAILSRGYGRKTKGFLWVNPTSKSTEVGDEPLYFSKRFAGEVLVAVCEKRKEGIQRILKENPDVDLILLDDAYQHRAVKAGMNILLTEYNKPFYSDFMLPTGNLRELRVNKKRADLIIVTKSPEVLKPEIQDEMVERINLRGKRIFFSSISYDEPVCFGTKRGDSYSKVLLVTGIANPLPLVEQLQKRFITEHISFKDHHHFTVDEIKEIHQKFDTFAHEESIILTTEKDYMRLLTSEHFEELKNYPWFYIPISVKIEGEETFKSILDQYVGTI